MAHVCICHAMLTYIARCVLCQVVCFAMLWNFPATGWYFVMWYKLEVMLARCVSYIWCKANECARMSLAWAMPTRIGVWLRHHAPHSNWKWHRDFDFVLEAWRQACAYDWSASAIYFYYYYYICIYTHIHILYSYTYHTISYCDTYIAQHNPIQYSTISTIHTVTIQFNNMCIQYNTV